MDTDPKPFVFVLMPFHETFDDVYQVGIKPACKDAGAYCERVDEQMFEDMILQRIYNQIAKADIVIAELTGRNPNVFYETGYAHALGKRVILLTQRAEDIPFDMQHYPHIIYEGSISKLKKKLQERIEWLLEQPGDTTSAVTVPVKYHIAGKCIEEGTHFYFPVNARDDRFTFKLDIHNPTSRTVKGDSFSVGLITPSYVVTYEHLNALDYIHLPDGRLMYHLTPFVDIMPLGWNVVKADLWLSGNFSIPEGGESFVLRTFHSSGYTDLSFLVDFTDEQN